MILPLIFLATNFLWFVSIYRATQSVVWTFVISVILQTIVGKLILNIKSLRTASFITSLASRLFPMHWGYTSVQTAAQSPTDIFESLKTKQCIFAVEPHGYGCLGLAIGFGLFGSWISSLPWQRGYADANLMQRTLVIGSKVIFWFPFIRELYSACGVIPNTVADVRKALLVDKMNLALIPSGIKGWRFSTEIYNNKDSEKCSGKCKHTPIFRRRAPGFLKLAIESGAYIVPVLSPCEDVFFGVYPIPGLPWFTWLAFPSRWGTNSLRLYMANPLNPADYDGDVVRFANAYYDALETLADDSGRPVRFHFED